MIKEYAIPVFNMVLTISVPIIVRILWKISSSIETLNTNVAVLIEKDQNKSKTINDHEKRIRRLEKK